MIALLFRAVAVIIAAMVYIVTAIVMLEVKLARMGWRVVKEWHNLSREQQWIHGLAGAGAVVLPVAIIVGIATTSSGGSGSHQFDASRTVGTATAVHGPRHHNAKPALVITHRHRHHRHRRHDIPGWLRHLNHKAPPPHAIGCTLTSTGNCIRGGEFCPSSAAGTYGQDGEGHRYICRNGHWETP